MSMFGYAHALKQDVLVGLANALVADDRDAIVFWFNSRRLERNQAYGIIYRGICFVSVAMLTLGNIVTFVVIVSLSSTTQNQFASILNISTTVCRHAKFFETDCVLLYLSGEYLFVPLLLGILAAKKIIFKCVCLLLFL